MQILLRGRVVIFTVEFDNDLSRDASEVSEERSDRMLSTKFQIAKLFAAQNGSTASLRLGSVLHVVIWLCLFA